MKSKKRFTTDKPVERQSNATYPQAASSPSPIGEILLPIQPLECHKLFIKFYPTFE